MTDTKDFSVYGQSAEGHFSVVDTIGIPHPYCITPKHVEYASDHCSGMLDEAAIEGAEKNGARCDICRANRLNLAYRDHKHALLVECLAPLKIGDAVNPELHAWLLRIKDLAETNHYDGFAFKDATRN